MSTLDKQLYIDAVAVLGIGREFSVAIDVKASENEESTDLIGTDFIPMNLTGYKVRFRILGSARGNGTILLEKIITADTSGLITGTIAEPESGEFTFTVTSADTNMLGLGEFPICLQILDEDDNVIFTLTEGGNNQGEFNKLSIVRV